MSHRLGLKVTAEGVETEARMAFLRLLGCDLVRGYRTGPPMAMERVAAFLSAALPAVVADPL